LPEKRDSVGRTREQENSMTSLSDDEIVTHATDRPRLDPRADADGDDTDTTDGDADDTDADDADDADSGDADADDTDAP
jgi:hypothetical protein